MFIEWTNSVHRRRTVFIVNKKCSFSGRTVFILLCLFIMKKRFSECSLVEKTFFRNFKKRFSVWKNTLMCFFLQMEKCFFKISKCYSKLFIDEKHRSSGKIHCLFIDEKTVFVHPECFFTMNSKFMDEQCSSMMDEHFCLCFFMKNSEKTLFFHDEQCSSLGFSMNKHLFVHREKTFFECSSKWMNSTPATISS